MLAKITIGWIWLERTLNTMIDAINAEKPLPSASIAVEESPNGTLLKVTSAPQTGDGGGGAGPTDGQWTAVVVVDPNTCVPSTLMVWAKPTSSR